MALSTFLRKSACTNPVFRQQLMKLATQSFPHSSVASTLPMKINLFDGNTTPIMNAVRSFRTTPGMLQAEEKPHDHAKLWVIEKSVSAVLVPLIPIALMMPNKILDCAMAILITAHSFWGLEAIAVDYVRASIFGPLIPKIAIGLVYALCIATLGGLFYVISNDIGISNTVRAFWAIKSENKA